jgi:hypothetical protein
MKIEIESLKSFEEMGNSDMNTNRHMIRRDWDRMDPNGLHLSAEVCPL